MQRIVRDDEDEAISISIGGVQRNRLGRIFIRCHRLRVRDWRIVDRSNRDRDGGVG